MHTHTHTHTHTHAHIYTHTHTQHGWQVILVPNPAIKAFPSAPYSSDDFLAYAELGVEAGVALFEIYGVASPLSMAADGNGLAISRHHHRDRKIYPRT